MGEIGDPDLFALWAKSDAGGASHSLPGHLLDTAAVAELIWDRFTAAPFREILDRASDGRGRDVFRLACGWHDLGKASPAFQLKNGDLAGVAAQAGWEMPRARSATKLFHGPSGHVIVTEVLRQHPGSGLRWIRELVEGHHGVFSRVDRDLYAGRSQANGNVWKSGQIRLAEWVAFQLEIDLDALHCETPPLGVQLATAGFLSMADWIASSNLFPGLGFDRMDLAMARERAERAWSGLAIEGGWDLSSRALPDAAAFQARFGYAPRPAQQLVLDAVVTLDRPSLVIVEAPTGEGKTEAAFSAIEALSTRLGQRGFVFAMPTQGTTDAMYARCEAWAHAVDRDMPVALSHGKAMANQVWRERIEKADVEQVGDEGTDPFGLVDPYESVPSRGRVTSSHAPGVPASWLLGRRRSLLSPGVVCTVDQPLVAATQTRYVALRHAGLAGSVLVIDEVHSYDVFMSQYLHALLWWCASAGTPVVLMSATLPPAMRAELTEAYANGLTASAEPLGAADAMNNDGMADGFGYPCVTTVSTAGRQHSSCEPWRFDTSVTVEVLSCENPEDLVPVVERLCVETRGGGCVLAILNTVRRAQEVYVGLRDRGVPVVIIHGRLTTRDKADRTGRVLRLLGKDGALRPARLVVVATQVAEQSFDVDADLLLTDVAPMDLLVQRAGRLHRHERDVSDRPSGMQAPRVVVTGMALTIGGGPPHLSKALEAVYDRYSLLTSAAMIGSGVTWALPSGVPGLVAKAYAQDRDWPPAWRETAEQARVELEATDEDRRRRAGHGVLKAPRTGPADGTLRNLHAFGSADAGEDLERVVVRDGEDYREVALVRATEVGYETLRGTRLGPHGERCGSSAVAREVLGDVVRVRAADRIDGLRPLAAWQDVHLLSRLDALVVDSDNRVVERPDIRYDDEVGLVIPRRAR